jgi:protein-tyrosine phosphatase
VRLYIFLGLNKIKNKNMSICKYDYDWILDDLAVGNIVAGSNLDNLLNHGINVVICAIPTLPLPIEKYKQKGIILLHIPIDDAPEVNIEKWFDHVSDFIMTNRLMGRKVLVHCHAGMSRSTTLACSYIMNLLKWDEVKALYWMRDNRPCTNINPGFLRQLAHYGIKYKNVKQ